MGQVRPTYIDRRQDDSGVVNGSWILCGLALLEAQDVLATGDVVAGAYCFHRGYDFWLTEEFVGSKSVRNLTCYAIGSFGT